MSAEPYRDRRVLVLGGLGFIGGHLSRCLAAVGARLTVVTRRRAAHVHEAAEIEAAGGRVVEADVRDPQAIDRVVSHQEVIFDLAARSGALRSVDDPFTDLDVNCRGILVLLEALRTENPTAKLVFVGSRLAYGRVGPERVAEHRDTDPLCVHGVHKLIAEKYLRVYGGLFGLRSVIARLTNPYGPGQPYRRTAYGIVNRLIHLALTGGTLTVYGDGSQRRDYIFIDDVVKALLALGVAASSDARAYNVGTGIGTRFIDMARTIVSVAEGGRIELVRWPTVAEQIETGDFVADISRIREDTGWAPAMSLEEGVRKTVAHYRANVAS